MDFSLAQSPRRSNQDEVTHVKRHIVRLKLYKTERLQSKPVFDKSSGDIDLDQKGPIT